MLKYKEAATFWLRAPRFSQIHRTIGDRVFGPFPKVAHPLHEKSAKDGALCKVKKKGPETFRFTAISGRGDRI